MAFQGFPKTCLPFLRQLQTNNNRGWFNENKQRYEDSVRMPALTLIEAIGPQIEEKLSSHFVAVSKKVGGSLMRVYRDIRFSKNKTPYKTNVGIQFRHELGKDVHAPGFYLHIEPGNCFIGAGIWRPESLFLNKIREFIVDNPRSWSKLMSDQTFSSQWSLIGATLIRPPKGFAKEHPLMTDLKRKDFIAHKSFSHERIVSASFVDYLIENYQECDAYMAYLCMALEVDY
jgi:uncharacterized protein (TIGR02453 family)